MGVIFVGDKESDFGLKLGFSRREDSLRRVLTVMIVMRIYNGLRFLRNVPTYFLMRVDFFLCAKD